MLRERVLKLLQTLEHTDPAALEELADIIAECCEKKPVHRGPPLETQRFGGSP